MARRKSDTPPADDPDAPSPLPDFEDALAQLEQIVAELDAGSLSLADSLAAFERGITLSRTCEAALTGAETKVRSLLSGLESTAAAPSPGSPDDEGFEDAFLDDEFDPDFDPDDDDDS